MAQSESQLCKLRHKSIFTRQHLLCADVPLPPGQRNGRRLLHFRMPQITRRIFFFAWREERRTGPGSGQIQCTSWRTFAPFTTSTITDIHASARAEGPGGIGSGCEVHSAGGTRWQESSKRQSKDEGWTGRRPGTLVNQCRLHKTKKHTETHGAADRAPCSRSSLKRRGPKREHGRGGDAQSRCGWQMPRLLPGAGPQGAGPGPRRRRRGAGKVRARVAAGQVSRVPRGVD